MPYYAKSAYYPDARDQAAAQPQPQAAHPAPTQGQLHGQVTGGSFNIDVSRLPQAMLQQLQALQTQQMAEHQERQRVAQMPPPVYSDYAPDPGYAFYYAPAPPASRPAPVSHALPPAPVQACQQTVQPVHQQTIKPVSALTRQQPTAYKTPPPLPPQGEAPEEVLSGYGFEQEERTVTRRYAPQPRYVHTMLAPGEQPWMFEESAYMEGGLNEYTNPSYTDGVHNTLEEVPSVEFLTRSFRNEVAPAVPEKSTTVVTLDEPLRSQATLRAQAPPTMAPPTLRGQAPPTLAPPTVKSSRARALAESAYYGGVPNDAIYAFAGENQYTAPQPVAVGQELLQPTPRDTYEIAQEPAQAPQHHANTYQIQQEPTHQQTLPQYQYRDTYAIEQEPARDSESVDSATTAVSDVELERVTRIQMEARRQAAAQQAALHANSPLPSHQDPRKTGAFRMPMSGFAFSDYHCEQLNDAASCIDINAL